jgi:hypothetical protein
MHASAGRERRRASCGQPALRRLVETVFSCVAVDQAKTRPRCPLVALSGHADRRIRCLLSGAKRTWPTRTWPKDGVMSACDPKGTFSLARASLKQRLRGGGVHGSEDGIVVNLVQMRPRYRC